MERTCGICQSVTYDDEESICSVCGAELSPAEDTEVEEVQEETVDDLDLSELENGDAPEDEDSLQGVPLSTVGRRGRTCV